MFIQGGQVDCLSYYHDTGQPHNFASYSVVLLLILLSIMPNYSNGHIQLTTTAIPQGYGPIRIKVYDTERFILISSEQKQLALDSVKIAALRLSKALRVHSLPSPLLLQRTKERACTMLNDLGQCIEKRPEYDREGENCHALTNFKIPNDHLEELVVYPTENSTDHRTEITRGSGIPDADLIVYVASTNHSGCTDSSISGYSRHCQRFNQDGRPIAGFIDFCPEALSRTPSQALAAALHHLLGILGFHPILLNSALPSDSVIQGPNPETALIKSPRVMEFSQLHFNCSTGIPIINTSSSLSWDSVFMHTSIMTRAAWRQTSVRWTVLDSASLALLSDLSSWYHVTFNQSDPFLWGLGAGCDFHETCSDSRYFCDTSGGTACHFRGRGKGPCVTLDPNRANCQTVLTEDSSCANISERCLGDECFPMNCSAHYTGDYGGVVCHYSKTKSRDYCTWKSVLCGINASVGNLGTNISTSFMLRTTVKLSTSSAKPLPTTSIPAKKKPARYKIRFPSLDYEEVQFRKQEPEIRDLCLTMLARVLNRTREMLRIILVTKGSVIVVFEVTDPTVDATKTYKTLQAAVSYRQLVITVNDVVHIATEVSFADEDTKTILPSRMLEIVVGGTIGGLLLIAIILLGIFIGLKHKLNKGAQVRPCSSSGSSTGTAPSRQSMVTVGHSYPTVGPSHSAFWDRNMTPVDAPDRAQSSGSMAGIEAVQLRMFDQF